MKTLVIVILFWFVIAIAQPPTPPTNGVVKPTPQQIAKLKSQQTNNIVIQTVVHLTTFSYYALQPEWQNVKCFAMIEGTIDDVNWVHLYKGPADNCYHNFQFDSKYKHLVVVYAPIL